MRRAWDAFAGLALLFAAAGAFAQTFPSKPVRIVVPFPPGGGADTLARIMEPKLAGIWAQPIVVENRPGASGHIGADFVARSAPDGHTLLMSSTASLTEKNVTLMFAPSQTVMPYVHAGKLKALAVTGVRRSETLPDLPTVAESGLPGYDAVGWFGLLAPAATPKSSVARASADVNRVLAMSDVREKMLGLGADPAGNTPEEFARFIRADQAKWSRLMKEAGITPE